MKKSHSRVQSMLQIVDRYMGEAGGFSEALQRLTEEFRDMSEVHVISWVVYWVYRNETSDLAQWSAREKLRHTCKGYLRRVCLNSTKSPFSIDRYLEPHWSQYGVGELPDSLTTRCFEVLTSASVDQNGHTKDRSFLTRLYVNAALHSDGELRESETLPAQIDHLIEEIAIAEGCLSGCPAAEMALFELLLPHVHDQLEYFSKLSRSLSDYVSANTLAWEIATKIRQGTDPILTDYQKLANWDPMRSGLRSWLKYVARGR